MWPLLERTCLKRKPSEGSSTHSGGEQMLRVCEHCEPAVPEGTVAWIFSYISQWTPSWTLILFATTKGSKSLTLGVFQQTADIRGVLYQATHRHRGPPSLSAPQPMKWPSWGLSEDLTDTQAQGTHRPQANRNHGSPSPTKPRWSFYTKESNKNNLQSQWQNKGKMGILTTDKNINRFDLFRTKTGNRF